MCFSSSLAHVTEVLLLLTGQNIKSWSDVVGILRLLQTSLLSPTLNSDDQTSVAGSWPLFIHYTPAMTRVISREPSGATRLLLWMRHPAPFLLSPSFPFFTYLPIAHPRPIPWALPKLHLVLSVPLFSGPGPQTRSGELHNSN